MDIDSLIQINKNLIYKIASKFYGVEKDDLYQAGILGLIKAYKNYEKNGEVKFSSYAYKYIYGEMYLLSINKNIKINKDTYKLYSLIEKARYKLAQKYNKILTNKELSEYLNIPLNLIENAIMAFKDYVYLDSDENIDYYDKIKCNENINIDDSILLKESINKLDSKEKSIIKARYFEDLTQSETAKKLRITQVMVSRYEKKSLNKMYEFMQR